MTDVGHGPALLPMEANGRCGSRLCENARTIGGSLKISSRFSAVFRHYRVGEAKKFASDAPFSDNFRVFTQVRRETGKE